MQERLNLEKRLKKLTSEAIFGGHSETDTSAISEAELACPVPIEASYSPDVIVAAGCFVAAKIRPALFLRVSLDVRMYSALTLK